MSVRKTPRCLLCGRIRRNRPNDIYQKQESYSFDEECWPIYKKFSSIYGNGFFGILESVK